MPLRFATDIKTMFTAMDQDRMLNQVGMFDLWKYGDVKANADAIYDSVENGSMPPGEPWSPCRIAKFKQWMDEGFQP